MSVPLPPSGYNRGQRTTGLLASLSAGLLLAGCGSATAVLLGKPAPAMGQLRPWDGTAGV